MEIQGPAPAINAYQAHQRMERIDSFDSTISTTETAGTDPFLSVSAQSIAQHRSFKQKLLGMLCCAKPKTI